MNRKFYFNITYACNNDCIMCASNSYKGKRTSPIIKFQKFKDIIQTRNIDSDDMVVLNGGEPTVHPSFEKLINICKKKDIFIYLFTNGRKFTNKNFSKKIIRGFYGRIAIPFYSYLEEKHDKITYSPGSFNASGKGVRNIREIIKDEGIKEIELELKTLVLRSNMNELTEIASFFLENFKFEHFLISSIHVSEKAEKIGNDELIKISTCFSQIRKCFDLFLEKSNVKIHSYFIPLCLLRDTKYEKACSHSYYKSDRECDYYFDPYNPEGMEWTSDKRFALRCLNCKYYDDCQGVWDSYSNYFGLDELIPF